MAEPSPASTPEVTPPDENLIVDLTADDEQQPPPSGDGAPAPAPAPAAPAPSESAAAVPPPTFALEELRRQVETDRVDREALTAQNRRLQEERDRALALAQEAERRGISTQEVYVENQLKAMEEQLQAITDQQANAYENGNWKEVAKFNRRIGELTSSATLLREKKDYLAQARVQPAQQRPAEGAPTSTDPVELASRGRTSSTAAFLRKHPELIRSDGTLKRIAYDAHEKALDEGFAVDSDGYFRHIEKVLTDAAAPKVVTTPAPAPAPQAAPTMAAPVSRSSAPGSSGATTFVMTPKMRQLAAEQGVAPKEWATSYLRLLKEGKVTPIT